MPRKVKLTFLIASRGSGSAFSAPTNSGIFEDIKLNSKTKIETTPSPLLRGYFYLPCLFTLFYNHL